MQVLSSSFLPLRADGQRLEVAISTLLDNTPEGCYFKGMLRFYGLDGDEGGQQQLEEVISR